MVTASIRACFAVLALLAARGALASVIHFTAILSGPAEAPPNTSPGTGTAMIDIDTLLDTMSITATFSGLVAATTASHIHCCTAVPGTGTAGVATTVPTFAGFPLGVTSGTYSRTLDLAFASSYNPAFVTANGGTIASAEAALLAGMLAGTSYFNIHTAAFPGGEIRGFLVAAPAAVSEPWVAGLVAIGLGAALAGRRRARRRAPFHRIVPT